MNIRFVFALSTALVMVTSASSLRSQTAALDTPLVNTRDMSLDFAGRVVTVEGVYRQINVTKKPGDPPMFAGYVALNLADSSYVMLENGDSAIRTTTEIAAFHERTVRVRGTLFSRCNLWGDGSTSTIIGPCLKGIFSLRDVSSGLDATTDPDALMAQARERAWSEIEEVWRRNELGRIMQENHVVLSCAKCSKITLNVELAIDGSGKLTGYRKLGESYCGGKLGPAIEKSFMKYFYEIKFPKALYDAKIIVRLGAGLSC